MSLKLSPPTQIQTAQQLDKLVKKLLDSPQIGVDTESNSLYVYREQVCLIQFSTRNEDFLLDPLVLPDLSPLKPVFNHPKITKIFHAAEYDLITMKRDFDFKFQNIFDTMVAARILGRQKLGYGNLVEEFFKVKIEKKFQRANWGQRPLTTEMMSYARLDTHFLIALREQLLAELKSQNLSSLAEEDFKRACFLNGMSAAPEEVNIWRMSGVKDLNPQQLAVLLQLAEYRQAVAISRNRPLFKIIGDRSLLSIAKHCPQTRQQLMKLEVLSKNQLNWHAEQLLAAVRQGLKDTPPKPPKHPRLSDAQSERYEKLHYWRKTTAQAAGVESDVILPKDIMMEIVLSGAENPQKLDQMMSAIPWRRKRYAKQILDVIKH